MLSLELRNIQKHFGSVSVIEDFSLDVRQGEFVVIVGPSGCGKSTLLKLVAGLENPSSGEIRLGGHRIDHLAPRDRNVAMVFQDYALYPHMSVAGNIGFGLKMRGVPRVERAKKVRQIAQDLQIEEYLNRRPKQLSGGQRQRVAMGRALARKVGLFLFDEPLSNLDAKLRMEMRTQIKLLHRQFGTTTLLVTHDQMEAMTLADRIVCLKDGAVAQVGTPLELYNNPHSLFVARFIGAPTINLLPASISRTGKSVLVSNHTSLDFPSDGSLERFAGRPVVLGLRPEHIGDSSLNSTGIPGFPISAEVELVETVGSDTFVSATWKGNRLMARCDPERTVKTGQTLQLHIRTDRMSLFDRETEALIV